MSSQSIEPATSERRNNFNGRGVGLQIHLFTPALRLVSACIPITAAAAPKTKELLVYLILARGRAVERRAIAAALWPDIGDDEGRKNLRRHLSLLVRFLAAGAGDESWIIVEHDSLRWNLEAPAWVDVFEFERHAHSSASRAAAIDIYAGDLLTGVDNEWLTAIRDDLRKRCLGILDDLLEAAKRVGDQQSMRHYAALLLRHDPYREDVLRDYIRLRAAGGDRAGALRELITFQLRFSADIGAELMPQTLALFDELQHDDVSSSSTLATTPPQPRNLPPPASSFVGRKRELDELETLVGTSRMVTVTGIGGMGKSRLVEQASSRLTPHFIDGVVFVGLASLPKGDTVVSAIVTAVGLQQADHDSMVRACADFFVKKRSLVLLDNCEHHLVESRDVVNWVTERCPLVTVLTTSRVPLQAKREIVYRLEPLSTPDQTANGRTFVESDAAQLFLERARAIVSLPTLDDAAKDAVSRICRRLDGIPLAIELAAARVGVLSVLQIADRLHQTALVVNYAQPARPDRQRTLSDIIAWSYDSLPEAGQIALRSFAVFGDAFTLDAAEFILEPLLDVTAALDNVVLLVERSLLRVVREPVANRYRLLEPVREFAYAQLELVGDVTSLTIRQVEYYAGFTTALGLPEGGARMRQAFDAVERERENIRSALVAVARHAVTGEAAVSLALSMSLFWQERGYVAEGFSILAQLAVETETACPASANVRLKNEASNLARLAGDYASARDLALNARAVAEVNGDRLGAAQASFAEAAVDYTIGHLASARVAFERTCSIFEELGDNAGAARSSIDLGLIDLREERYTEAVEHLRCALERSRNGDNRRLQAFATSALAFAERFQRNYDEAGTLSMRALALARDMGNLSLINTCLANLATIAVATRDGATARHVLREGLTLARNGSFAFALIQYLEMTARLLFDESRYEPAAELLATVKAVERRFALVPTPEDAAILDDMERVLSAELGRVQMDRIRATYDDASTQECADVALAAIT